jgi:hypothetical protein
MARLLRDPAARGAFGLAGRERASATFGMSEMIRRYEEIYADQLATDRG